MKIMTHTILTLSFLTGIICAQCASGQDAQMGESYIRLHYSKHEYTFDYVYDD